MVTAKLRLLATTDLHMHLTGYDYVAAQPTQNPGLAGLATLIEHARAEAKAAQSGCILLDNGDLLQGTAMGDWLSHQPVTADHPAIASLNALAFDAVGVGNHDLDYGLPYLRAVASHLTPPMIASNITGDDLSPLQGAALVPCRVPGGNTTPEQVLQIGVLSVLPEQTALWNHQQLDGQAQIGSAEEALRRAIPALRARGADIVIVLAHMGLGAGAGDTALPLAHVPGIDAMITGHTHRRFPGADHASTDTLNSQTSTLKAIPTVMPGHAGSDLAVLDLDLRQTPTGGWTVRQHRSALRPNTAETAAAPAVLAATAATHEALHDDLSTVVGEVPAALHNYFAVAAPTAICALTARAMATTVSEALGGTPAATLPLLAVTSAHTAGGRDGPGNYLHIPRGPMRRRHLAGIDPYSNKIWAAVVTGAQIQAYLEYAACLFTRLSTSRPDQPLRDVSVPIFRFDTIHGLTYEIDPTRPLGARISRLRHAGDPVGQAQRFVLATNPFRAVGGGGYPTPDPDQIILRSDRTIQQALTANAACTAPGHWQDRPWSFRRALGVKATLFTSPDATEFAADIAHLAPEILPPTTDGFAALRITL